MDILDELQKEINDLELGYKEEFIEKLVFLKAQFKRISEVVKSLSFEFVDVSENIEKNGDCVVFQISGLEKIEFCENGCVFWGEQGKRDFLFQGEKILINGSEVGVDSEEEFNLGINLLDFWENIFKKTSKFIDEEVVRIRKRLVEKIKIF